MPSKIVHIDVSEHRWKSPKRQTAQAAGGEKAEQHIGKLRPGNIVVGLDPGEPLNDSGLGVEGLPSTAPPPRPIQILPGMTIDSIGPGKTVEEDLIDVNNPLLEEGLWATSFQFTFFRSVWFDSLEAYNGIHWILNTNYPPNIYLQPIAALIPGTIVRGRYVTK